MNQIISKAILSGLGLASLTRDAIRETAHDLVKRSKLSEEEGKRLVKDFQRRSVRAEKVLEKKVGTAVRKALKHLNLEQAGRQAKSAKSAKSAKGAKAGGKSNAQGRRRQAARTARAR
jgi:polyhydroxyalkanoate synthesis regulator phasin